MDLDFPPFGGGGTPRMLLCARTLKLFLILTRVLSLVCFASFFDHQKFESFFFFFFFFLLSSLPLLSAFYPAPNGGPPPPPKRFPSVLAMNSGQGVKWVFFPLT